ncbi:hypothetical protein ACSBR2_027259 [Camellia fascicularis]
MDQPSLCCAILLVFTSLTCSSHLGNAKSVDYGIATLSTSWTISNPTPILHASEFVWRPILFRRGLLSRFTLGFCCNFAYTDCIVGVFIQKQTSVNEDSITDAPQLVWSANRNHSVKLNATLHLTQHGDLTLADADGTSVWSTNTGRAGGGGGGGKYSVLGLNLTEDGNLVLFDQNNATVWQSFDYPTDSLLPGQKLVLGQKLTASTSASNWSQGLFSLAIHPNPDPYYSLLAYVESNPPLVYFRSYLNGSSDHQVYVKFENGSFNVEKSPLVGSSAQFISDGTEIAVKRLNGFGQVKKSFLAEVETIGSIHHINLVRLIGFCAEKSYRLLVYEYMSNGSLDKWIFQRHQELTLGWQSRRKIIMEIAKGLSYLHEECRQKIFHLDIKPQNILLDEYFNAKISDFGLSKLIDKDQSQVVTTLRGTPGYLAPEWLSSIITEKVDVYSFGVVVLEMLCGRKNLDRSQPEEDMHLLSLFKRKAEEERLIDIVDKGNDEMQLHSTEVVEMMRVAVWCLQSDFSKRPSMSVVVKVLEGSVDVDNNLDYNFINPVIRRTIADAGQQEDAIGAACTLLSPLALSGPR